MTHDNSVAWHKLLGPNSEAVDCEGVGQMVLQVLDGALRMHAAPSDYPFKFKFDSMIVAKTAETGHHPLSQGSSTEGLDSMQSRVPHMEYCGLLWRSSGKK